MTDFRIVQAFEDGQLTLDWLQTPLNLLDESQQLASAILIALNSDAAANDTDVLPDPRSNDRRGWWGDLDAATIWGGWPLGSKLWLLRRAKIVDRSSSEGATTTRVQQYILAALQPFIDNGLCSKVTVSVNQLSVQRISATITIYRGPKPAIQLQYQPLWQEIFPGS